MILLVGMAVGVDYSLFYLRREREERAAGHEPHKSLLRAASTSGQAVLISDATVLIAMAGMFFAGTAIYSSIGLGTIIVVFVAVVGSLSVPLSRDPSIALVERSTAEAQPGVEGSKMLRSSPPQRSRMNLR